MPVPGFPRRGLMPLRIGHVALLSTDPGGIEEMLVAGFGCYLTDRFENLSTFLTCNRDHHVFNLIWAPASGLHHIAFELRDVAHMTEAADLLARDDIALKWGPSRHTAGGNYALYYLAPDGNIVELYAGMDQCILDLD